MAHWKSDSIMQTAKPDFYRSDVVESSEKGTEPYKSFNGRTFVIIVAIIAACFAAAYLIFFA